MSFEQHSDDCPHCRPALIDVSTGEAMPPDSIEMKAVNSVWETTTLEERKAFHRFTCQNSREPSDLLVIQDISRRMEEAMRKVATDG